MGRRRRSAWGGEGAVARGEEEKKGAGEEGGGRRWGPGGGRRWGGAVDPGEEVAAGEDEGEADGGSGEEEGEGDGGSGGGGRRRRLGRRRWEGGAREKKATLGEGGRSGEEGHAVTHAGAATSRSTGHVSGQGQHVLFWTSDEPLK